MINVGIIMGSDSDLPVMQDAAKVLEDFGVEYEISVISAHRTPKAMYDYAENAVKKGLKVIIAGAGGAAHLPGMTAAITTMPVIGVPIKTRALSGVDSLYSIVQMPGGIPVATVAINAGKNAGLLAVQMLAAFDSELMQKVIAYRKSMEEEVLAKAERLSSIGYKEYLGEQ